MKTEQISPTGSQHGGDESPPGDLLRHGGSIYKQSIGPVDPTPSSSGISHQQEHFKSCIGTSAACGSGSSSSVSAGTTTAGSSSVARMDDLNEVIASRKVMNFSLNGT